MLDYRTYIDVLTATYMVRVLKPFVPNIGKRLVKSPRLYVRDSGLLHALLGVVDADGLLGHPVYGASWEGFVIEHVIACLPDWTPYFYRTADGAELDLVLEQGTRRLVVEAKASIAPSVQRGFWQAVDDVAPEAAFIAAPVSQPYPLRDGVTVRPLGDLLQCLQGYRANAAA